MLLPDRPPPPGLHTLQHMAVNTCLSHTDQGVVNHEKTVCILAKSLALVAEAMPRVELVALLYPTLRMQKAVEELYAALLKFLIRAHDWYNETPFLHALHSITRPPELRYQDLLAQITHCSRTVYQLAVSGSQAELRVVHDKSDVVLSKLESLEAKMSQLAAQFTCA